MRRRAVETFLALAVRLLLESIDIFFYHLKGAEGPSNPIPEDAPIEPNKKRAMDMMIDGFFIRFHLFRKDICESFLFLC